MYAQGVFYLRISAKAEIMTTKNTMGLKLLTLYRTDRSKMYAFYEQKMK